MPEAGVVRSEDELGRKWDRCVSDSLLKIGGGIGLGALFSVLFFKRRAWPLIFGTGAGFGMSYSNCQQTLQSAYNVGPIRKKAVAQPPSQTASLNQTDETTACFFVKIPYNVANNSPYTVPVQQTSVEKVAVAVSHSDSHPPQTSVQEIPNSNSKH